MHEMQRQLRAIGELRRRLLPVTLPQPPGWHIAVHSAAGAWPGASYYDLFRLSDRRLALVVADASDQGGPAVVMTAMVRLLLHSCPLSCGAEQLPFCPFRDPLIQPPHLILGHLSHILAENYLEGQFVTAFCGILDPLDGNFHYANAGHPAPRWWRASTGSVESLRDAVGRPLGIDRQASYHHKRVAIGPGDLIALYSRGLLSVQDDQGQAFGCQELDHALCEAAGEGGEAVIAAVRARLDAFLGGKAPEEDVTLLIIERQE